MKTNNGHGSSARLPTYPECRGCGEIVDLQHDDVLMEKLITDSTAERGVNVWHKDCYDLFLNEGGEC